MTLQPLLFSSIRLALKPLVLVAFLLAEGVLWGEILGPTLPKGLPQGLERSSKNLTAISLPPSIDRLEWLPEHIEILNASGTQIRHLKGLPSALRELDVSYTELRSLDSVPQNLRVLDIRETQINHLTGLPPKLESLKVANQNIYRLGNLPASLSELHLENTRVSELTGLPPRLQTLYFEGESLESLDGLPDALQSLTLISTKVRNLRGLPPSLQKLELVNNRKLQFQAADLPPLLTWLDLDLDQPSPNVSSLKYLAWYSDRTGGIGPLPNFLSSLTLRVPGLRELPEFPRSLRALGLLNATINFVRTLPPELEVLDLTDYTQTEIASLRYLTRLIRLELAYSSLTKLPELPPNLQTLVLSGTKGITSVRGLPSNLQELVFCDSGLIHLNGKGDLPASLKRLDLCQSRGLENLSSVPVHLTYLNLEGTAISKLPTLGDKLQELDVSNTKIERLNLSRLKGLKVLTVSEGQLKSMTNLPPQVTTLRIVRADRSWASRPAKN